MVEILMHQSKIGSQKLVIKPHHCYSKNISRILSKNKMVAPHEKNISLQKKIFLSAMLFLSAVLLTELSAFIALYVLNLHGKTFEELYDPTGNTARFRGKCDDYLQTLQLDPYLGFVHNRGCADTFYSLNNLGFMNQDVDLTKKGFYSIGIFGGSVASQFAGFTAVPQMEEILTACFNNKKHKPFRVLNFADGGWKQPQQVIALGLYGDYLDAAISIEGYNERYYIGMSSDLTMPASSFLSILNDDIYANLYFKLRKINWVFKKSNSVKLVISAYRRALERRAERMNQEYNARYSLPAGIDVKAHNVDRYHGFIKSFDAIAATKRLYSLIILQPSPLHKALTDAEKKNVGPLDYEQTYDDIRRVLSHASNFLDLSELFKNSSDTIFADVIHFVKLDGYYRSYGNYVMSKEIIKRLVNDRQIFANNETNECVAKFDPTTRKPALSSSAK